MIEHSRRIKNIQSLILVMLNCPYHTTVSILRNNDTMVGHVTRHISKQFTAILKSGGIVKVKVIAKPVNTMIRGFRVPCIYIASGKGSYLQDIKDNVVKIFKY